MDENERKVKEIEPKAEHSRDPLYGISDIIVYGGRPFNYRHIGHGATEAAAWKDALRRLESLF